MAISSCAFAASICSNWPDIYPRILPKKQTCRYIVVSVISSDYLSRTLFIIRIREREPLSVSFFIVCSIRLRKSRSRLVAPADLTKVSNKASSFVIRAKISGARSRSTNKRTTAVRIRRQRSQLGQNQNEGSRCSNTCQARSGKRLPAAARCTTSKVSCTSSAGLDEREPRARLNK
uniref:Uncharacterized protein n=1 Tax=Candidatus Kentrum sp. LFY TaxID=2126342 RepID=A0A450WQN1_9GAMM|nr:MAG: hypothetical protein BECKLFY1418C_GA0070996_10571 [Candidatus Kentron sp. LFY]